MRVTVIGVGALLWSGCIAFTGLGDYEIVDQVDAAGSETSAPAGDARVDDAPGPRDASVADVDAAPVDAGPCGPCPRGTARKLCIANKCEETRRAFVTRKGFSSLFGGFAKADEACQEVAKAAKLGGQWKAWFSTNASSPRDRFATAEVPYRMLDGTQLAAKASAFVTPMGNLAIDHTLDLDENEKPVVAPENEEVWTGSTIKDGDGKRTCNDWTSNAKAITGTVGAVIHKDAKWQAIYLQQCDRASQHLYCFEQ